MRNEVWAKVTEQLRAANGWDANHFFSCPELYHGQAPLKAVALAEKYEALMKPLLEVEL